MRFSVNVSTLFTEAPLLDRFALASAAGFAAAECWWPEHEDPKRFVEVVRASGVRLVLINFYGGNLAAGDRGVAGDPVGAPAFRENVPIALEVASALGCRLLHALVGIEDPRRPRDEQLRTALENVRWAARQAARYGARVLLEPINPFDNGPYLLPDLAAAAEFARRLGVENVGLQFDTYHVRRTGQPLIASLGDYGELIHHVQIADVPGRSAPGTGETDFAGFFAALDRIGYGGHVGLEYVAQRSTEEALAWLPVPLRSGDGDLTALLRSVCAY